MQEVGDKQQLPCASDNLTNVVQGKHKFTINTQMHFYLVWFNKELNKHKHILETSSETLILSIDQFVHNHIL